MLHPNSRSAHAPACAVSASLLVFACSLALTAVARAAVSTQPFDSDPFAGGWELRGHTNLFHWEASAGVLGATWDSSETNSFCSLPLPTACTEADDFAVSFDLRLLDFQAGINPQKPNTFQLALGFFNAESTAATGFVRGSGSQSPNLVEFAFFPDPFGLFDSVTGSMCDQTGTNWAFGYTPSALLIDRVYRVTLAYTASDHTLRTTVTMDGAPFGPVSDAPITPPFQGFRVDRMGVCSYNDEGQDPLWAGSILAHGTIDNVVFTTPDIVGPVVGGMNGGAWQAEFASRADYLYSLQRTTDLVEWADLDPVVAGTGGRLTLEDPAPPPDQAFYRVRARIQP